MNWNQYYEAVENIAWDAVNGARIIQRRRGYGDVVTTEAAMAFGIAHHSDVINTLAGFYADQKSCSIEEALQRVHGDIARTVYRHVWAWWPYETGRAEAARRSQPAGWWPPETKKTEVVPQCPPQDDCVVTVLMRHAVIVCAQAILRAHNVRAGQFNDAEGIALARADEAVRCAIAQLQDMADAVRYCATCDNDRAYARRIINTVARFEYMFALVCRPAYRVNTTELDAVVQFVRYLPDHEAAITRDASFDDIVAAVVGTRVAQILAGI